MKVRAKNIAINPVYWHYGVKWPIGVVMEYDLPHADCAAIQADPRLEVEIASGVELVSSDDVTPIEKPVRLKKGK